MHSIDFIQQTTELVTKEINRLVGKEELLPKIDLKGFRSDYGVTKTAFDFRAMAWEKAVTPLGLYPVRVSMCQTTSGNVTRSEKTLQQDGRIAFTTYKDFTHYRIDYVIKAKTSELATLCHLRSCFITLFFDFKSIPYIYHGETLAIRLTEDASPGHLISNMQSEDGLNDVFGFFAEVKIESRRALERDREVRRIHVDTQTLGDFSK